MIRNIISISNNPYIVDVYKSEVDLKDRYASNYVMLRNFSFTSEVTNDKDVYVLDKATYDRWMSSDENSIYPVTNKNFIGFSKNIYKFNDSHIECYELTNKDKEPAKILCDVIRIYHPHTSNYGDAILYIDNYINQTHFHWLCRKLSDYDRNGASNEFRINNFIYSEYIEFFIPSPENIISDNVFFRENTCIVEADADSDVVILDDNYMSMSLYNSLFTVESKDGISTKTYKRSNTHEIKLDYISFPINVTIFPYSEIDENGSYIEDDKRPANSDMFNYDTRFMLSSRIGFNEDVISSINTFNFPNKKSFSSFRDAYSYYYGVDLKDYVGIIDDEAEDYNEEDPQEQKQCGFEMKMFRDRECRQEIARMYFEIDDPESELDDFAFPLIGIFDDWRQYEESECIIIKTRFLDKYLGLTIEGNDVYIDKEQFKYMLNKIDDKSIISIKGEQEILKDVKDMDLSKINFIDKINCVIRKKEESNNIAQNTGQSIARVMYKPIFFKAYDLQNIFIRLGFKQNVGINLADYMTKVETFKLIINGQHIYESSRNEVYVIFNIDGSLFNAENSGEYHILDQDDNYISSGSWSLKS